MAWDETMRKVWVKAIGTVESSMNYAAINYNDPITVGIGQWYGTRAAALINKMKNVDSAGYGALPQDFRNVMNAHNERDAFWNTYYLPRNFGDALKPFLLNNRNIQDDQLIFDANATYRNMALKYGINPDTNTETFILWAVAYHQSPQRAMRIGNRVGGTNLDGMKSAILSDSVLGVYSTRYNTAYNIIKSKDTSGVGSSGSSSTTTSDGNGGRASQSNFASLVVGPGVGYLLLDNSNLVWLRTRFGTSVGTPVGINLWKMDMGNSEAKVQEIVSGAWNNAHALGFNEGSATAPNPGGGNPGGGGDGSKGAKALKWMMSRIGKFGYRQAPGRLDPDNSGFGDCSSTIYRAYKDTSGTFVGTWTGDQYNRGREVMPRGSGAMTAAQRAMLRPGDMIVMAWRSTGSYYPETDHVEMVVDSNRLIGHGGNPYYGPVITSIDRLAGTRWWTVRRHD